MSDARRWGGHRSGFTLTNRRLRELFPSKLLDSGCSLLFFSHLVG